MTLYEKILIESIAYSFEDDNEELQDRNWKINRAKRILLDLGPEYIPDICWPIELDLGIYFFTDFFKDLDYKKSIYVGRNYLSTKTLFNSDYDEDENAVSDACWVIGNDNQYFISNVDYIISNTWKEYVYIKIIPNFSEVTRYAFMFSLNDNLFSYTKDDEHFYRNKINFIGTLKNLLSVSDEDIEQITGIIKAFNPKAIVR